MRLLTWVRSATWPHVPSGRASRCWNKARRTTSSSSISRKPESAAANPLLDTHGNQEDGADRQQRHIGHGISAIDSGVDCSGAWLGGADIARHGVDSNHDDENKVQAKGVASLLELRDICPESEVKFIACQMTVDLLEFKTSEFIKNIESGCAPTINKFAGASNVCPFI